jgi:hypothetical protein
VSEETWEQRHERERREYAVKMEKAWAKYKARKDGKREKQYRMNAKGKEEVYGYDIVFDEGTRTTDTKVESKTTTFRFDSDGKLYAFFRNTQKKQRFLVVSGPKAGERITDEDDDYVLYNIAGRDYRKPERPQCVLVHVSSFA